MAQIKGSEANVIDVKWKLCEETGKLGYDSFRLVSHSPRQTLLVANAKENLPTELVERYWRILMDRTARGISHG